MSAIKEVLRIERDITKRQVKQLAAARERERLLREALEWYAERAESLAVKDWRKNPQYAEAIFVELCNDGGRRANAALNATEGGVDG